MARFRMPSLGADMDEGTVLEWLIKPGDRVSRGDVVAVVDTAKAAVDVECFDSGVVREILVPAGRKVPVGVALAVIDTEASVAAGAPPSPAPQPRAPQPTAPEPRTPEATAATAEPPPAEPAASAPTPAETATPQQIPAEPAVAEPAAPTPPAPQPVGAGTPSPPGPATHGDGAGRIRRGPLVAPPARKLAAELGVDLATVHGTGEHGGITRSDIQRAVRAGTPAPPTARRRVSPYARKLAANLGIDRATVSGTGPDGEIRARDVRAATASTATTPAPEPAVPATASPASTPTRRDDTAMRQAIAGLMARSKREIPHYYLTTTIDLATALDWLREYNRTVAVPDRLLPAALLLKATAVAAQRVPRLNGHWVDGAFVPADAVHLGVAIALRGGGLIAPAILDAAALPLPEIMRRLRDLVTRTRSGRLRGTELTAGTITVTNLGDLGVESVHGVIYPPQVALVGFGAVVHRPWAVDGLLGVRPVVTATLAGDHRATDGATGAALLNTIDRQLQRPEEL